MRHQGQMNRRHILKGTLAGTMFALAHTLGASTRPVRPPQVFYAYNPEEELRVGDVRILPKHRIPYDTDMFGIWSGHDFIIPGDDSRVSFHGETISFRYDDLGTYREVAGVLTVMGL